VEQPSNACTFIVSLVSWGDSLVSWGSGRYRLSRRKQILEEQFAAVSDDADWSPRYNIAPTQLVPVIRRNPRSASRELSLIRWGLGPYGRRTRRGDERGFCKPLHGDRLVAAISSTERIPATFAPCRLFSVILSRCEIFGTTVPTLIGVARDQSASAP